MNRKKAEMAKKAKANAKQTEQQTPLFGEAGHILSSPARSLLTTHPEKSEQNAMHSEKGQVPATKFHSTYLQSLDDLQPRYACDF